MNTHKPRTKEEAHKEALAGDLEAKYSVGDHLDLVVIESPRDNNGREAFARHNDVSVFVYPTGLTLNARTRVRVKVSEVQENCIKSVAVAKLE